MDYYSQARGKKRDGMESPGHEPSVNRLQCILNISKCFGKISNTMLFIQKHGFASQQRKQTKNTQTTPLGQ